MCLTMHFTAKLLKSCAVYTPTFEYLSAGQFNYPGPSVISAALLSPCLFFRLFFFCGRRERFVCSFIKIQPFAAQQKHTFLLQYRWRWLLLHPCISRYCTYKVIPSRGGGGGGGGFL